jgi:hypothetical protein
MLQCDYCGESCEHVILIPKPKYFIWNNAILNNVSVFRKEDLICLDCLKYELDEIKWN